MLFAYRLIGRYKTRLSFHVSPIHNFFVYVKNAEIISRDGKLYFSFSGFMVASVRARLNQQRVHLIIFCFVIALILFYTIAILTN